MGTAARSTHRRRAELRRAPRIAIIGAGPAGLCMAMRLKAAGFTAFTLYEAADQLGGTWRANTYPGASCDIPAHLYSFSFAPDPDWRRKFATQPEIAAYLKRCAEDHGIVPHIRFGAEIGRARFDEAAGCWRIAIAGGWEEQADILVSACGQLNRPYVPDLAGRAGFEGKQFHAARWDHGARLDGDTVAVIGSAATAIQIVPEIARRAGRLLVFQRSPNWIARKRDRAYSDVERRLYRGLPGFMRLVRNYHFWRHEWRCLAFRRRSKIGLVYRAILSARIRRKILDPAVRAAALPGYPVGCKRVLLSNDWFGVLQRPNVDLVTSPIVRLTASAIETADGRVHPVGTLIYATGFESTRFLAPMRIEGAGGRTLDEAWVHGAQAYRGVAVAGFPNLFLLYGPNTNLGHNSVLFMIECQVRYVISCLEALVERRAATIAVKPAAMQAFNDALHRRLAGSVWAAGCGNWYTTSSGRITNNWSGSVIRYWRQTRRCELEAHVLSGARDWGVTGASTFEAR